MAKTKKKISLITALFNEDANLAPLCEQIEQALSPTGLEWELIMVDDGSTDHSAPVARSLHEKFPWLKLISLSRNFGQQAALTAGMDYATGDAIITMDADLQHPPAMLPDMINAWQDEGFQIINTVRIQDEDYSSFKRFTSKAFYRIFSRLAEVELRPGTSDYRLLDRAVVDELKRLPERHRFLRGLVSWVGFKVKEIPYAAPPRFSGEPKFNFRRMLGMAMDGITSFSTAPLKMVSLLGFLVTILAFCYLVYVVVQCMRGAVVPGWSSMMVMILLLGGIQLVALGIIGQYLGRIYGEVKGRPHYVIKKKDFFD